MTNDQYNTPMGEKKPVNLPPARAISATEHLRNKITAGEGAFPITFKDNKGSGRIFIDDRKLVELSTWVAERNGRVNLYEHINPVRPEYTASEAGRAGKKAALVDIALVPRFHADLDPRAGHDWETERSLILALLVNVERLRELGFPGGPSKILDSGGGFWAFWELVEPIKLPTIAEARASGNEERFLGEAARDVGRYNEWIAQTLNREFGGDRLADGCHNIDRVCRLVGTKNLPDEKKIAKGRKEALAQIVGEWPRLYTPEQFQKTNSDITNFTTKAEMAAVQLNYEVPAYCPEGEDAHDYARRIGDQYNLDEETIRKILLGDGYSDQERDKTKSGVFINVLRACLRKGVPHDVIIGIVTEPRFACSAEALNIKKAPRGPVAYAEGKLRKHIPKLEKCIAEERAKEEVALSEQATLTDKIFGSDPSPSPAANEPAIELHRYAFTGNESFQTAGVGGPNIKNEYNVLLAVAKLKGSLRKNELTGDVLLSGIAALCNGQEIRMGDDDMVDLKLMVERIYHIKAIGKDQFYDWISSLARANKFHPILDYLDSLKWDGVPRLNNWLIDHAGARDDGDGYVHAVASIPMVAAVRRVRQPGCKFDEMPVLEGAQGTNKSTGIRSLCKDPDWFTDSPSLGASSKEMIEQLQGSWIVEIAELQKRKDHGIEAIKAQLSRQEDKARLAYGRITSKVKRQSVFFGTTNSNNYLEDPTGGRRFWPVRIESFNLETLEAARDQLWAEASHREAAGESIRLPEHLWAVAARHQKQRTVVHPWEETIGRLFGFLDALDIAKGMVSVNEIFGTVLGIPVEKRSPRLGAELKNAMMALGFEKDRIDLGGHREYYYVRGTKEFILDIKVDSSGVLFYEVVLATDRAKFYKDLGGVHGDKMQKALERASLIPFPSSPPPLLAARHFSNSLTPPPEDSEKDLNDIVQDFHSPHPNRKH